MSSCALRCDGQAHEARKCELRHFVYSGYRLNVHTFRQCLSTLFMMHNQTWNIWTHLLGFVYFLYFGGLGARQIWQAAAARQLASRCAPPFAEEPAEEVCFLEAEQPPVVPWELVPFLLSAASSALCMLLSTYYHLTLCYGSEDRVCCCLQADIFGILQSITGSCTGGVVAGFKCWPTLLRTYVACAVVAGACGLLVVLRPNHEMNGPLLFLVGAQGLAPAVHWTALVPWTEFIEFGFSIIGMFFWMLVGFVFFHTSFPESRYPGRFDIWFNSHQFFHVFCFLGLAVFMRGIKHVTLWRLAVPCQGYEY